MPLSAAEAAAALCQRAELQASCAGLFWLESDPASGLIGLWSLRDGRPHRLGPAGYSCRSRVNGYGGGALCAWGRHLHGVNEATGLVDTINPRTGNVNPLIQPDGYRYGGLVGDLAGDRLLAVRERVDPEPGAAVQQLVAIELNGTVSVLHSGEDFYGAPAISSNGRRLAWVSWSLPDMPWQTATLWAADVGAGDRLVNVRPLPTPTPGAVQQPCFAGFQLCALSDHQGWWQPYRIDWEAPRPRWSLLSNQRADHANAPWQLGECHHLPLPAGGGAWVCYQQGVGQLWLRPHASATEQRLGEDYVDFRSLCLGDDALYALAYRSDAWAEVVAIDRTSGRLSVLAGGERPIPPSRLSRPQAFSLAVAGPGDEMQRMPVSGFYYPPVARAAFARTGPPPLILQVHGGPTSMAYPVFNPQVQFWCQHGFAVADINHRGSSGFGRDFRLALAGGWGQVEVDDIAQAAGDLVARGLADPCGLFIQGRSAGGYTALMTMVSSQRFRGAVSLFGVSDPLPLRQQTHRFESGYLDWLLGEPRRHGQRWRRRTPARQAHRIAGEVLFFQGSEDRVVVPQQTAAMVEAMTAAGGRATVTVFQGEGHGFRQPETQCQVLEQSLAFFQRLMGERDARGNDLG